MRIEALARIVAAAAVGRTDELPRLYQEAHREGVGIGDLAEATLQVFLFAGYPRTIGAFQALHAADLGAGMVPSEPDRADFRERGLEVFGKVYGKHAETVLEMLDPAYYPPALTGPRRIRLGILGRWFAASDRPSERR